MKRILFLSILAALLCGCVPAANEGRGSSTDTISIDSVDNVVVADTVPAEPEPVPEPPFTSPDLKWLQLQGHVKQLIRFGVGGDATYNFDRQGNFISYHDSFGYPYEIKRNKKGQIVGWYQWMDETDFYYGAEYSYNNDGYIYRETTASEEDEDEYVYVLNEQGWPVSASWKCEDGEMVDPVVYHHKGTVFYTYSNIDDHGNWRKCVVKSKHPYFYNYTETRKITYWE